MAKGKIFIISGPSGSGKTTLHNKLLKSKRFRGCLVRSVSTTTRPKRKGEKNGRDYNFVSHKMFLYKKRCGHFLECEKVFGNYYGTPLKGVRDLLKAGKSVLLCIDVKGARTVRRKFPDVVTIFIKTKSFKVLAARLGKRGSEQRNVVQTRLKTAKAELKEEKNYQHIIVNDQLSAAYRQLESLVAAELKA